MAYVITDNNFTRDSYDIRSTRLNLISANIDDYSSELELELSLLTWAQGAGAAFMSALINQTDEQGEADEAYQVLQAKEAALLERYQQLKDLLISRYGEDNDILNQYGVRGQTPKTRSSRYRAALELIEENQERHDDGDELALPLGMTASLATLAADLDNLQDDAFEESSEAKQSTKDLSALFEADTDKLRVLYNWVVSYWGKRDSRLINLGFVEAKDHHGGATPEAPTGLAFDAATNTFSWDASETATSYQLAYRAAESDDDWEVAYSGADTSTVFDPGEGLWEFKVRARNSHGFGDFSTVLDVDTRPLPAPENLRSEVDGSNPNQYDLLWDDVATADSYDLYISRVALGGDPSTFWVDVADATSPTTIEVNASRTEYYKVKAKRGGVESDFSNMIRLDWTE